MEKWKVSSNTVCGVGTYYQVYQLIDEYEVDHSGNRAYLSAIFETQKQAQAVAEKLNVLQKELEETSLLLSEVVDWIIRVSNEPACGVCTLAEDNEATPDDVDPCPYRRKEGWQCACRRGLIAYFKKKMQKAGGAE